MTEALALKPVQSGIDYDIPDQAATEKCSLEPYKLGETSGWEVRDENGSTLRRYLDTNADNKVDQWCYFKAGIEVYRDIDSNHNRKADQYRWLGTAGMRWALDTDEDGRIDQWKMISPEEVTEEAVLAMREKNADRFKLLLLTPGELRELGLGAEQGKQLAEKLAATSTSFEQMLRSQQFVPSDAEWVNFGGTRPGVVPAGANGAQKDLHVYENVAAVIESKGTHNQVVVGTLVQVGDVWRLFDLPSQNTAAEGFFFAVRRRNDTVPLTGMDPRFEQLMEEMESIDKQMASTDALDELAKLNARRADILEELAGLSSDAAEKTSFLRQLAETVGAAAQSGQYPEGVTRLATMCEQLEKDKAAPDLIAYVKFRQLLADYVQSMQSTDDFGAVQEKWLRGLEQFVKDYPGQDDSAEAMMHLALAEEFAGNDEAATNWYQRVADEFAGSSRAQKASGAVRRIDSVGQPLTLTGKDLAGRTLDVQALRGRVVLVHYWSSDYPNCLPGLSVLKDMQTKYGKDKLAIVGVNLDGQAEKLQSYLQQNPLPWPQLYAAGGFDSPLANQYGVQELPLMILADQQGKVVNRRMSLDEIDGKLRQLIR